MEFILVHPITSIRFWKLGRIREVLLYIHLYTIGPIILYLLSGLVSVHEIYTGTE